MKGKHILVEVHVYVFSFLMNQYSKQFERSLCFFQVSFLSIINASSFHLKNKHFAEQNFKPVHHIVEVLTYYARLALVG